MNRIISSKLAVTVSCTLIICSALLGSTGPGEKDEALEKRFDGYLKQDNLREWMRELSSQPHHVGTEKGKKNAEFIAEKFKSWGYMTKIETFYTLFPEPKTRMLKMIAPTEFAPRLQEPALADKRNPR